MQMMLKPQKWFSSMMREAMRLRAFGLMNWENTKVCRMFREYVLGWLSTSAVIYF